MAYITNKIFMTDSDMLRDKKTPYKIVLPKNPTAAEKFAAEELAHFFFQATGVKLAAAKDSSVTFDVAAHYFSVGNTSLYEKLHSNLRQDEFDDVVELVSKGNMIFFNGSGQGCVFAVYEFLKIMFDYRYFAKDEYRLASKSVLKVPVLDIRIKPDIARRSLGYYDTERDYEYIMRLRLGNSLYSGWIEACHTYFRILPKEKYYAEHPDWYSPDGSNLCLSNPEMKQEFIRRVEEIIESKDGCYFMLGQEDNFDFCGCEKCKKKIAEYGVASGLVMEFTNEVAAAVGEWLKKNHPERRVRFVAFAYNMTFAPPVRYNASTNCYEPIKKDVVAAPNVSVMIVPYNAVYSTDYLNDKNKHIREAFYGWQAISKHLQIWSYCTIYENYMLPFNNFGAVGKNYRILADMGVEFLYDAASYASRVPQFEELRQFVQAELMWDTTRSTEDLIDEFMNAYYGEAAPEMRYVLSLQRARWQLLEGAYQKYMYSFDAFNELMDRRYWSLAYVNALEDAFALAFESVKTSPRRELLENRIEKEYAAVRYLRLSLYPETIADLEAEKKKFAEDRKKFGLLTLKEGADGALALE